MTDDALTLDSKGTFSQSDHKKSPALANREEVIVNKTSGQFEKVRLPLGQ